MVDGGDGMNCIWGTVGVVSGQALTRSANEVKVGVVLHEGFVQAEGATFCCCCTSGVTVDLQSFEKPNSYSTGLVSP
eukprot:4177652-Ditylum_brightwellii.AAC.1